ncbi:hypothetical protein U6A24_03935 [Aquimarina gracilis]|uniref:Phospholipase/carboxylesterase/thioesterase domain-containing protein n=1 Tax=Aquimarina gracilis TaxID=874422 RepID=A0ABU5ZTK2_9FLAO|nr:hypothetical protein [Aquimarina gracilis]MEB3344596.1 hypothetical protein [Aquimarina gracilis]
MRLLIVIVILHVGILGNSQPNFEKGKIVDSIPIEVNSKETFALYLPTSFEPSKLSPVVFIFEPAARGKIGIKPFIEASEKHGHILICSNNSRNGPYAKSFDIANRLFKYALANFNIEKDLVFLAGFSGGSRLASAIAVLTNQIAGVIACGAGFSLEPSHRPSIQKFSYAGICGDQDMNYTEMIRAKGYLQKFNFSNTLFIYPGDHKWPPSEQITRAFDWLEIQSHLKGIATKTQTEIVKSYVKNYEFAYAAETNNKHIKAVENYERILTTYGTILQLDSIGSKLKKILKSKEYKTSLKSISKAFDKEDKLTKMFYERFNEDYPNPDNSDLNWWRKELDKLKKTEDQEMNKMVTRLRYKIFAMAFSRTNPNLHQSSDKQKQLCRDICKIVYPRFK